VGVLCIKHKKLKCKLCPDEADEVVIDRVNGNKAFKTVFFNAEKSLDALDEHRVIPGCHPPTDVFTNTSNRSLHVRGGCGCGVTQNVSVCVERC
jgi:hypothetical protein